MRSGGPSSTAALPDWRALSNVTSHGSARKTARPFASLTTSRFALWLCGIGVAATLYVGHVHGTQQKYEELHALRKENLKLRLERDRLQGELDLATGPTVIYPKAHDLGLKEGFEYGPTLTITNK